MNIFSNQPNNATLNWSSFIIDIRLKVSVTLFANIRSCTEKDIKSNGQKIYYKWTHLCLKAMPHMKSFFGKLLAQVTFQIKKVTFSIRKVTCQNDFPNWESRLPNWESNLRKSESNLRKSLSEMWKWFWQVKKTCQIHFSSENNGKGITMSLESRFGKLLSGILLRTRGGSQKVC